MEIKNKIRKESATSKIKAPLFKIVMVGDSGVGKTALINCFINDGKIEGKSNIKNSVGIDYLIKTFELKRNCSVRLEIWDTAGNDKLRTMISSYYKGAHGIILVYDYTNVKSFYSLKNWMKEIKHFANENAVKYLVCNKIDCISHDTTINSLSNWTVSDEVSYTSKFIAQEAEKFAIQNSMKYLKTSALNNVGVYDLFKSITSDIVDNCDDEKIKCRSESIKLGYINNEYFNSGIVPKETVQRPSQYSCCNF